MRKGKEPNRKETSMDPRATLIRILEAILEAACIEPESEITKCAHAAAAGEAVDALRDLADWMEAGGFAPDVRSGDWNWPTI